MQSNMIINVQAEQDFASVISTANTLLIKILIAIIRSNTMYPHRPEDCVENCKERGIYTSFFAFYFPHGYFCDHRHKYDQE